jgi:hypothetical protein
LDKTLAIPPWIKIFREKQVKENTFLSIFIIIACHFRLFAECSGA